MNKKISLDEIIIRDATVWDAKAIADMWELEMEEMQMPGRYCNNVEKEKFFIDVLLKIKKQDAVVIVAEHNNNIISFASGFIYTATFGASELIGYCENRYVYKEYRSTKIVMKMLKVLKSKGEKLGAKTFEFIIPYREGLVKVYKRLGYEPSQVIFRGG